MKVIRFPEDPDIPKRFADQAFKQAERDPFSVLVVAWSPFRWKKAAEEWQERTSKERPRFTLNETDRARWDLAPRTQFPISMTAWLSTRKIELVVVSDDYVILPNGMPGGHRLFREEPASYCPICKHFSAEGDTC